MAGGVAARISRRVETMIMPGTPPSNVETMSRISRRVETRMTRRLAAKRAIYIQNLKKG